ncbi:porin [Aliivibrio finisterrensis]|uniref:OprD family porin n=1 Tax=Aliivibrio finisterrensis TaxID=511998 RepID=A0A6N6RV96_9GAMM|nr:porin [Aliivibrio finisterrensis]KAB2825503.1 OprD family porin [Aliivibrio finisterrensis]
MENKFFKVSAIAAALTGALVAPQAMANVESAAGGEYVEVINEFIKGSTLSGLVVVDTRYRSKDTGDGYKAGQDYSDYNAVLDFKSGYHDGWLGADVAGYFSGSLYNNTGCSEITLCDGWDRSQDSLKLTTAALKFKTGEVITKLGYIQSHGIGTVGNVWSFVPGTYRGASVVAPIGDWTLGYIFADNHSAPWWENTSASSVDPVTGKFNGENAFNSLQSIGLNGQVGPVALNMGLGYSSLGHGEDSTSYKFAAKYAITDTASIAYDIYGIQDDTRFDGAGITQGVSYAQSFGSLTFNSEARYVTSDNDAAVAPRTAGAYGSNNGTFSQYWNALSDWDQSNQLSWYNKASYNFGNGWFAGAGVAVSTIDNDVSGYDGEYAVNGDIGYSVQSGSLKGSTLKLHVTQLTRDMTDGSDYDWSDVRLQVFIPYNFM